MLHCQERTSLQVLALTIFHCGRVQHIFLLTDLALWEGIIVSFYWYNIVGGYISFYWFSIVGGYLLPIVGLLLLLEFYYFLMSKLLWAKLLSKLWAILLLNLWYFNTLWGLSGFTMANYSLFPVFFIRLEFRSVIHGSQLISRSFDFSTCSMWQSSILKYYKCGRVRDIYLNPWLTLDRPNH